MNGIVTGQVVFSKCGRDKGLPFIVLRADGEFLYLTDGEIRKLSNAKKKKCKHVQPTKYICENIAEAICTKNHISDSDIRKAIAGFRDNG